MDRRSLLIGAGGTAALLGLGVGASIASEGSPRAYAAAAARLRAPLPSDPPPADLIRYATLAANGHNTQPWRFRIGAEAIDLLPDFTRRTPIVDPDDHHLFVSLGCAGENLAIAAAGSGRPGELTAAEDAAGLRYAFRHGPARPDPLLAAIPRRQSTRGVYDGRAVAANLLGRLAAAAAMPGVDLMLITDRPRINRIRDLVLAGNAAQLGDPAFIRELRHWLRFNPRAAMAHGDGLYSAASGNPVLPSWLGKPALDLFFTARSDNARYARHIASSAGLAVFVGAGADRDHWIQVGRACQRFMLTATSLGLRHAFLNQPIEVPALRDALAREVGAPGKRPDLVLRFGYGPALPFSLRRPVQSVLIDEGG